MANIITRSNAEALIPQQVVQEIIQELPTQSVFLSLAKPMPQMTSKQQKIPVLTGLATAGFIAGDTAQKPTSNLTWDNVYITAEELAVIVPIPEAVLDDASYDIWAEVRPRITEAFGKAIDAAAFFGTNKPDSWPAGIVNGAISAGNVTTIYSNATGADIYQAIEGVDGVIANVEEDGIAVDGFVGALQLRARLRGAVDANGQPIFRAAYSNGNNGKFAYELEGSPVNFPANGSWDASKALLLAGSFAHARYAIRQDITFKLFDQGTITDGSGNVSLSLMENDTVALRAVMRLGWAIPKPVNAISGTSYYPFAILQGSDDAKIGMATYSVTQPAKSGTPQSTHSSGTGYTATIAWSPNDAAFAGGKKYTATVTYTAADGYIFEDDFGAKDFTGLPATSGDGHTAEEVTVTRTSNTEVKVVVKYVATAS